MWTVHCYPKLTRPGTVSRLEQIRQVARRRCREGRHAASDQSHQEGQLLKKKAKELGRSALASIALASAAVIAAASPDVSLSHAWARATVPGQPAGAAYLDIRSATAAAVVEIRSDAAGIIEMHTTSHDRDVMRMRRVEQLLLPAGKTVSLGPGGTHVMLMDLRGPLRDGESIVLDLIIESPDGRRRTVRAMVPVRSKGPAEGKK